MLGMGRVPFYGWKSKFNEIKGKSLLHQALTLLAAHNLIIPVHQSPIERVLAVPKEAPSTVNTPVTHGRINKRTTSVRMVTGCAFSVSLINHNSWRFPIVRAASHTERACHPGINATGIGFSSFFLSHSLNSHPHPPPVGSGGYFLSG